jgi:hypothetical protein
MARRTRRSPPDQGEESEHAAAAAAATWLTGVSATQALGTMATAMAAADSPAMVWCRGTPAHVRHDEGDQHVDDSGEDNETIRTRDLQPGPHERHSWPRAQDLEVHLIGEGAVPHRQSAGWL